MIWQRNDNPPLMYFGVTAEGWPKRMEVVCVEGALEGTEGWMDVCPWADREDKPFMMGPVYRIVFAIPGVVEACAVLDPEPTVRLRTAS